MRILIADDDRDLAQMLSLCLADHRVHCVYSGYEAIEFYARARQSTPYDLIVLDLAMTDLTGFQVEEAIRATGDSATKVVFLSGHFDPSQSTPHEANLKRASGVWRKPIEPPDFRERVAKVLEEVLSGNAQRDVWAP